jgi:acetyl esterase
MPHRLLTPRMAQLLERIHRAQRQPFHTQTPEAARATYEAAAEVLDLPRASLERVQNLVVAGGDGHPRPARLYAPSQHRLPVLLYLHGGGFVVGSLETHDALCRQLALRAGCAVLALDYRLAPEYPFPAAFDDAWAAFQQLPALAEAQGLDGRRLAVAGDSAGGTLAATTALKARNHGLQLSLQLLITPGTGPHADTASHRRFAQGFLMDAPTVAWFFDHTLAREQRTDWRFAPLLAEDHEGLAPLCMLLAECDPLVDEGVDYADALRRAHVPVDLEIYKGVTHDFIKMGRVIPEAVLALDAAARAIRQAFDMDEEQ